MPLTMLCLTNLQAARHWPAGGYPSTLQSCHSASWVPTPVKNKAGDGITDGGLASPAVGNRF